MPPIRGMTGYVMAGGGSTRFGRDKALVEVGGRPMLARMVALMQGITEQVKIAGTPEKYAEFGIEVVSDRWPGEGPLGGIITALLDAASHSASLEQSRQQPHLDNPHAAGWCLIVSCDMPFLTHDWLAYLSERAAESTAQVVMPLSAGGPEPLCACYRADGAEALQAAFEAGVRKITDALKHVTTEVLDEVHWKRFDSAGRLFWNMNTAADFEEVLSVWEAKHP